MTLLARGLYGVAVLLIGRALDVTSLSTVLIGVAAVGIVPLLLVPLLSRGIIAR